jgi:CBS domain-containing protein
MPNRKVSEVIGNRSFPIVSPNNSVHEVSVVMREWKSSAALVMHRESLLGICTERDIVFKAIALGNKPKKTSIESIMTRNVQTIHKDKPFGHALHLMYEGGFRHLPVVDDNGAPVGLISSQDALDIDRLEMVNDLVRREEITVIL